MHQALLTRRYLTSKVMPLLAALGVALSAAMVLTVWSVMGGFLNMLLASGRSLMGDAALSYPVRGIPWYEELVEALEADDRVAHATPTLEAPGLLKLPGGAVRTVQVVGVQGESYDRVTGYAKTLWWRPIEAREAQRLPEDDLRRVVPRRYFEQGLTLTEPDPTTGEPKPAIVLGVEVSGYNQRTPTGGLTPRDPSGWWETMGMRVEGADEDGWIVSRRLSPDPDAPREQIRLQRLPFLFDDEATLSVLPLSQQGVVVSVEARRFPIANEFRTDVYEVDASTVLVRLDALQKMLGMDEAQRVEDVGELVPVVDPQTGEERFAAPRVVGVEPARATSVLAAGAPGVAPEQVKQAMREVYARFAEAHAEAPDPAYVRFYTWQERPGVRTFIAAVKKEISLVLGLFGFISLTAVFLVFAIFWAMVSEKTRDVGVLRALGVSRRGVAWLFLRYGLALGVVGGAVGLALAFLIVRNINAIHSWLSAALHITIWDPSIYYFTRIPNQVDPWHALLVFVAACLFSVTGALVPALKAARLDPVRALRFE